MLARRLVLTEPYGHLYVAAFEPTEPKDAEVLIANKATSLNHLDWKRIDKNLFIPSVPHVLGMDVAGIVAKAGPSSRFVVGERLMCPGTVGDSSRCSFQTHVLADSAHCSNVPEEVGFPAAATLPFLLMTAACGLYVNLKLSFQAERTNAPYILIWGANGNVGQLATQLARVSGYRVIGVTSSPKTIHIAKARGAHHVFSNDDIDLVQKILAITYEDEGGSKGLRYAFDTVVSAETVGKAAQILGDGGILATAIKSVGEGPTNMTVSSVYSGEIMGKTMTGSVSPRGVEVGSWLWSSLPGWLTSKQVTPLEFEVIGRLEHVEEGLQKMKTHIAKEKLVAVLEYRYTILFLARVVD